MIATTTVGLQFAEFKEVATSSQHFLSTFIKFHVQIKIDDDDNDDDDDKLKQISWPHMLIFVTCNKN